MTRPNILFIMTDQQSWRAMSCLGNPYVKTPAIDSIANRGVLFEQCYCNNPICVPSRTNWLMGKHSHQTGVKNNVWGMLNIPGIPLTRYLSEGGYQVGYVGKWHIPHDRLDSDWTGIDTMEVRKDNALDPLVVPACETFFRQSGSRPFFLAAEFVNPHDICEYARIISDFEGEQLQNDPLPLAPPSMEACPPLPPNHAIPEREPECIRWHQEQLKSAYPVRDWTENQWRRYLWAYYRLVETVDAHIGGLLSVLKKLRLEQNTIVIFTSDHGEGLAAHGWNQKTLFYEEVSRIPMIIADPRLPDRRRIDRQALVSMNIDMLPTILEYAEIPVPEGYEGISLRPLVEGRPEAHRHQAVFAENDLVKENSESVGKEGRMIRTNRYKYVCYSRCEVSEQLFDLKNDPGEMNNLVGDPGFREVLVSHRQQLRSWSRRTGDPYDYGSVPADDHSGRSQISPQGNS